MLLCFLIFICSIWTLGLTIVTQKDMYLYSFREWADKHYENGANWTEPLIRCYWCMPSLHSFIAYGLAYGIGVINQFEWKLVFMLPLVIAGASILNGFIWGVLQLIRSITDYYDEAATDLTAEDVDEIINEHIRKIKQN